MTKIRDKLIALGPQVLADALVERLVATAREKVARFRARLTALKRGGYFYDWRQVSGFARELEGLLADLADSVEEPGDGVDLMALSLKRRGRPPRTHSGLRPVLISPRFIWQAAILRLHWPG